MFSSLFPSSASAADEKVSAPADLATAKGVYAAFKTARADVEAFTGHVAQMSDELKRIQKERNAERSAAEKEKQELEAAWMLRLRTSRLEVAMRAGLAARDLRVVSRSLKQWVEAVGSLRHESLVQRNEREQQLQLRLRDSGRAELQQERAGLLRQATASALAAQQLRSALSARSQELERTIVRDTMAFELQAADAARIAHALEHVNRQRDAERAAAAEEAAGLRADLERARREGAAASDCAQLAVGSALAGELAHAEAAARGRAANAIIVVRLGLDHSTLHRYWKVWAVVASLLLREAGAALLQLELSKQQQRGVHTRLQAQLTSEAAVARVENIEARTLLAKAGVLEQLRPGHEIATNAELLREQSRALQAAHESAAAAHMAAARHRVGEETLHAEMRQAEAALGEAASAAVYGQRQTSARLQEEHTRALQKVADRAQYDAASLEMLQQQEAHTAAHLRRAGVELRVLVRSMQVLEAEAAAPAAPAAPPPRAAPRAPPLVGPGGAPPPAPGQARQRAPSPGRAAAGGSPARAAVSGGPPGRAAASGGGGGRTTPPRPQGRPPRARQ